MNADKSKTGVEKVLVREVSVKGVKGMLLELVMESKYRGSRILWKSGGCPEN